MKYLIFALQFLLLTVAFAGESAAPAYQSKDDVHRYLIERTFPAGALDGLDAATKAKVNANNASVGVTWVESYANAAKTKTYCVYEGPSEAAVRKAAELNKLPVDRVTEVPIDLTSNAQAKPADATTHRYLVTRTFAPGALDGLDDAGKAKINATNSKYGVRWVSSLASADKTKTYCVYEGPSETAVRDAAKAAGIPVDAVAEVPVTLLPH